MAVVVKLSRSNEVSMFRLVMQRRTITMTSIYEFFEIVAWIFTEIWIS